MAPPYPPPSLPTNCHGFFFSSNPAIKLFGNTIPLPPPSLDSLHNSDESKAQLHEHFSPRGVDELGFSSGNNSGSDNEDLPLLPTEKLETSISPLEAEREEEEEEENKDKVAQDKILKRPHKPVACPRCDSMDTKFCYFNNYNINQPRHFCRNCQRYWTAGGTLRNVPVGAGRRKNKHASEHKQLGGESGVIRKDDTKSVQPRLAIPQVPGMKSAVMHISPVETGFFSNTSSTMSSISSATIEAPFCGDTASSFVKTISGEDPLNLSQMRNLIVEAGADRNPGLRDECGPFVMSSGCEMALDTNIEDLNLAGTSIGTECDARCNGDAFPFVGIPWPYMYMSWAGAAPAPPSLPSGSSMWSPFGDARVPASASAPDWSGPTNGFGQFPSFPGAVWNPGWNVPSWNLVWGAAAAVATSIAATGAPATSVATTGEVSEMNRLGKRLRASAEGTGEGSFCIPKTLRIHDPEEAAHSSILTTLGVYHKSGPLTSSGIFNAFQPKAEVFQPNTGTKLSEEERCSNPAAMSRSMAFQESNKSL